MPMNPSYTLRNKRVWVAGDRGLVGSALVRRLQREGCEIVAAPRDQVDLRRPDQTEQWMAAARPQAVFLAAARVGGIYANDTRPAEFIYDNLMIQSNVVEASRRVGVEKLMLLGSSCIYPRLAPQPIPESGAAHRAARADQPVVRDRQDRRHQARPGLSPPVRLRLHLGHADQPLRAG